jgi:hypothetical protein
MLIDWISNPLLGCWVSDVVSTEHRLESNKWLRINRRSTPYPAMTENPRIHNSQVSSGARNTRGNG